MKSPADPKVLCGFAAAILLPRLGGLWRVASRKGRAAVAVQLALLATFLACGKRRRARALERIDAMPPTLVPAVTLLALVTDTVAARASRRAQRSARLALWAVLAGGMLPSLTEALDAGWSSVTSGEADIPALLAMQLGLCLNQVRAAAVILLMLTGGEAFEEHALQRAGNALHALLQQSPGTAHVSQSGDSVGGAATDDVSAELVKEGDVLLIKQGETVPVDGTLLHAAQRHERVHVDDSLLTGEGLPAHKAAGALVLGGSLNKGTAFWIKSSGPYGASVMALMKAKLAEALESKANLELESKRFVAAFTPITFAMAAVACLVSDWQARSPRSLWESVLSVFMSATPCPAGIGVPIAMLSGMSVASRQFGGTIKSGAAIEALARADVAVLDKTGTLTCGSPSVVSFLAKIEPDQSADLDRTRVLQLLASVEQFSTHPLAQAVGSYFRAEVSGQDVALCPVDGVDETSGLGIAGSAGGLDVRVGSFEFCFPKAKPPPQPQAGAERLRAFFRISSTLAEGAVADGALAEGALASGSFEFEDAVRPSAKRLVARLKGALGMRVVVLSGDRSGHLAFVANELGVDEYAACWPHEKAERVKSLRDAGHVVLMVGDGANDSAALAAADVGLSIGASNLAADSASVVLMNDEIDNVANLVSMSRKVVRVARRTVLYGMSASLLQMCVAALGLTSPFASALVQEGIDLGAVLHALRALSVSGVE